MYEVYREEVRTMAYVYVELIGEFLRTLPPSQPDWTYVCPPPEKLWPRRTYYPRHVDLFHSVASIMSKEHHYCVKWKRTAPRYIYLRWVEVRDVATDIDDAPGLTGGGAPVQFSGSLGATVAPSSSDWLKTLRSKMNQNKK